MRRRGKTDGNHTQLADAFRAAGCTVQSLADVGDGCPDLLVGISGRNLLVEVKDGRRPPSERKLTPDQVEWHGKWRGQVATVKGVDEALALVNQVRQT